MDKCFGHIVNALKPSASSFFPPVERTDPETPPDRYLNPG